MVQNIERTRTSQFPVTAPTANPVFFRTYSRRIGDRRESLDDLIRRTTAGLVKLGKLTPSETELLERMQRELKSLPSGRWLWVGGTEWIERPENFSGSYNCTSTNVVDWRAFGLMMDLAMMGCGTGAVLEQKYISQLLPIRNRLNVTIAGKLGNTPAADRRELTEVTIAAPHATIYVGDSRQGWVQSYQSLLELSTDDRFAGEVNVTVDVSDVRPAGEKLKGFGGVANPVRLPELYDRCATILNKAVGRQLSSVECCLLIDEAAVVVVAGNVRRCLPENALVHTQRGLIAIKHIQVGELVQTPLGFRRVVDKFDQGVQDIAIVKTNGTFLRATENHRVAVMTDAVGGYQWKQVKELAPGDRLLFSQEVLPGTPTALPADHTAVRPEGSSTCRPIQIPALNAEVAWMIGLLHGDGCVHRYTNKHGKPFGEVSFSGNAQDGEVIVAIKEKLERAIAWFGLTVKHGLKDQGSTYHGRVGSIRLAEYLLQIKQPNQPIVVPDFILQATPEIRAAYLAGLFDSDGSIKNRPPQLICTVYPEFRDQVACLYASLGIPTRNGYTHPIDDKSTRERFTLSLVGFRDAYNRQIAPYSAKGWLEVVKSHHTFTLPGWMMRETYSYSQMREMGFEGNRTTDSSYERYIAESGVDLDVPIAVEGLERIEVAHTYDIEVEDAHCFYADGFLTHNSAGMRQSSSDDTEFAAAKENLWQQDDAGNWRIDPERDALRMANHTRVFHHKPTQQECVDAVRKQFYSGEGAIQYAPEAIARASADLLPTAELKVEFLKAYTTGTGAAWLQQRYPQMAESEIASRLGRYGLNPCGEIIGENFHCNLAEVHLNQIDPANLQEQEDAFTAGALSVAALLNHQFTEPRYQESRQLDPIVGVSFTGLFDFFVHAFGVDWLRWWEAGRPDTVTGLEFKTREQEYLTRWREIVHRVVGEYCDRHGIKRPNRCTTIQPAGTKSLLTGASPGWHPPKAQRFIRRITFRKNDPVAMACIDYGYSVVPSQSDKDETGNLLNDPFDSRCTEWLVEIPVEVSWANLPGADQIAIEQFSALAQLDFYMQVQRFYTAHNTSATIELREDEIEALGQRIFEAVQNNEGYISAALLARFDAPFPRLPFEKIDHDTFDRLSKEVKARQYNSDFYAALSLYDSGFSVAEGPAGCDSDKCLAPEKKG